MCYHWAKNNVDMNRLWFANINDRLYIIADRCMKTVTNFPSNNQQPPIKCFRSIEVLLRDIDNNE